MILTSMSPKTLVIDSGRQSLNESPANTGLFLLQILQRATVVSAMGRRRV